MGATVTITLTRDDGTVVTEATFDASMKYEHGFAPGVGLPVGDDGDVLAAFRFEPLVLDKDGKPRWS